MGDAVSWTAIEDALRAWVLSASGLDDGRVIWSQQGGPRPDTPFVTLQIFTMKNVGQDWVNVEDADEGEVEMKARGAREATLVMQCFATDAVGAAAAAMLLNQIITAARLPSNVDALNAAGVGLARFEPVQTISGVVGSTDWEPRATVSVRFFLAVEVSEPGTYIRSVQLSNIDDEEFWIPDGPPAGAVLSATLEGASLTAEAEVT